MKIKKGLTYSEVLEKKQKKDKKPPRQSFLFSTLVRVVSLPDLWATKFRFEKVGMEKLKNNQPCLILMNHSSFIDLKIANRILYPRKYNIVCTSDGFVGRNWLMRQLGCISTKKYVGDVTLLHDMLYAVKKHRSSVLMYPEAGYSFDGRATALPDSIGRCIKILGIPVVVIITDGAFLRDPLYNNLQKRKVEVTAKVEYLLSPEEIKEKSPREINALIAERFAFDNFRSQKEKGVLIDEPFRADNLNRVLYKCPHCLAEGQTEGKGTELICHACGKRYELCKDGSMKALDGETEFSHIPDWYDWQRECVRREILDGEYKLNVEVDIGVLVDTAALYMVGEGRLTHDREGIRLTGCDGKLRYEQKPRFSYSVNSDYYWYQIADMISIGTQECLYYCFPKTQGVVTKTRIAAEELFKISMERRKSRG